jgi:hypothetical protein
MKTEIIPGILKAVSPIHHGGDESTGARSTLRRMKFVIEGNRVEIPVISGNSIRGVLRRLVMADMLETLGYGNLTKDGSPDERMQSLKAYHMLFSGGTLESVNSGEAGQVNLELRRKLRANIPALSVFGSAIGNQMLEGKMKCGFGLPVCAELKGMLTVPVPDISIHELIADDFLTRRDDLHGERKEDDPAHQMLVNIEVFAPGTDFVHQFALVDCSEIEAGVLGRAIELWKAAPYIGGKSAVGYGMVALDYKAIPDPAPYTDFLSQKADDVKAAIEDIETLLK